MNPGVIPLVLLLAAGAGRVGLRARTAETRSKRLGMAAVACGLAGFIPALLGPAFKDQNQSQALTVCGIIAIACAAAAVVLAIGSFWIRRRDRGVAVYYPVAGLVCGAANLFFGAAFILMASEVLAPTDGNPWIWRSEKYGFEVTVPSERWSAKTNPNVLAEFTCSRPPISAGVAAALPAETDAEYDAALAYGKKIKSDTPTSNADERSGQNRHGHPHWVYMGDAQSGDKRYFFGVSITRVGGKAVLMMFEGPYRFSSEVGRAQEARSLRTQAELFLGSVK